MSSSPFGRRQDFAGRGPRLRQGLVVAEADGDLLIEGGPSRQLLAGSAAASLLPRLLPLLDGRHSREQVCAELSIGHAHFDQVVTLLRQRGLLEWVRPWNAIGFEAEHVAAYMSRTIGIADSCLSADDLAGDLAAATVLVAAPPALAGPIAADLAETGVGTVRILRPAEAADVSAGASGPCLAAVFDDPVNADVLDEMITAQQRHDWRVLRFSGTADYAEVGPVFCGPHTACIDCFRRSYKAGYESRTENGAGESSAAVPCTADAAALGVLASLVTSALLSMLTRQAPAHPLTQLTRTTLSGALLTESYEVVPDLECASCVGGTPPQDAVSRDMLTYEWRVRKMPPSFELVEAPTPARQSYLLSLQQQRDEFPTSPGHGLPSQPAGGWPDVARSNRPIDEDALVGILTRTAGFQSVARTAATRTDNWRWAPSGGNMASVAVYLVTDAVLYGLPGTILRYDDIGHRVISIRDDAIALAQFLDETDLDASHTDVAIVLVGEAGRLSQKYTDFAWRLTHLDTGCAALQLSLVAACYGLRATFASTWPARLNEMLELERHHEVVTAIAGLSADNGPRREGSPTCR
jgi:SagB-type dehydrogenase family enzyme